MLEAPEGLCRNVLIDAPANFVESETVAILCNNLVHFLSKCANINKYTHSKQITKIGFFTVAYPDMACFLFIAWC